MMGLPLPVRMLRFLCEKTFPITHPPVKRNVEIARRTKEMHVIRHQQVIADQPSLRLTPRFQQKFVNFRLCNPRHAFLRANGDENNCRFTKMNVNARCRFTTPNVVIWRTRIHKSLIREGKVPGEPQIKFHLER